MDVYEQNRRVFDSGIDSGISKKPSEFDEETLAEVTNRLLELSKDTPYVLVQWGQDYGGPKRFLRYHPLEEIGELKHAYVKNNVRGIFPKAGLVIDQEWIDQKPHRTSKSFSMTRDEYREMVKSLNY